MVQLLARHLPVCFRATHFPRSILRLGSNLSCRCLKTNSVHRGYKRNFTLFEAIADDITIHARTPDLFELSSMLKTLFEHHQLPLNIDKSWIIGSRVFSQTGRSTLPCSRLNEGGKILGVPVGDLASCIFWMEVHFS